MPERIQRKRTKGWRMPEGAVYVGRPTVWGNPFTVMNGHRQGWLVWDDRDRLGLTNQVTSDGFLRAFSSKAAAIRFAVRLFRRSLTPEARDQIRTALAGRDLTCWCPLDSPCHGDVLLEIANAAECERPVKSETDAEEAEK